MNAVRVRRAVEAAVPGWFGEGAMTTWPHGPDRRAWSYQFHPEIVTADGDLTRLVVKVPLWDEAPTLAEALAAGPQEGTKAEADILERIASSIVGEGLAVIRVRGYLPEINAIVMDRFEGRSLKSLVGDPREWDRVPAVLGRVGRWLRRYHDDVAGVSVEPLTAEAVLADVKFAFVELRASGQDLGEPAVRIRRALRALSGRPVPVTTTHGDFTLANVLVASDGAVVGLDPNPYRGPAVMDLAKLIVELRTHRLRTATFGLVPTTPRLAVWESALVAGYGDVDRPLLTTLVAATALERLREAEEVAGSRRIFAPFIRRWLTTELERAVDGVSRLRPHHALGMRPPVPDTILEKPQISGPDQRG